MRALAVLTLIAMQATQAAALSCLAPDPVRTYLQVDQAPEQWGAVVGRLDFDETWLPRAPEDDPNAAPPQTLVRAQLIGHSLGPDGWTKPFQDNVTMYVQCLGPWCARPVSGGTYLAFLQREPHRHVAIADPCGAYLFPNPSRKDLDRLQSCFDGGPCQEGDRR